MVALRISDLARAGDVGVETIRFYQRKGLMPLPDGSSVGARHYDDGDVRRLRFIRGAQAAGFSLAEIAELMELDRRDDRQRARELAKARIAALDAQIAVLQQASRSLRKLAHDCASDDEGPCPILTAFDQ